MRFSRTAFALSGIALSWFIVSTAVAQEGKRGGRGGGFGGFPRMGGTIDKPTLLGSEQVRKELKIGEEQGKKVEEVLSAHREGLRGAFGGFNRDASDEERAKAREESAKKTAELVKKTEAKLAEVLDKAQNQRLDEIALQQQGADGLVGENVVAALKLSKEQVDKIKAAISTRDTEIGKLRGSFRGGPGGGGGGGGFEEIREKTDKLRKEADTTAASVLSKEQTEALAKLKGAAFELDRASLFRAGGGGGRGGRGGPGGGGDSGKERKRPPADDEKKDL